MYVCADSVFCGNVPASAAPSLDAALSMLDQQFQFYELYLLPLFLSLSYSDWPLLSAKVRERYES
jgi:hypothetical protein